MIKTSVDLVNENIEYIYNLLTDKGEIVFKNKIPISDQLDEDMEYWDAYILSLYLNIDKDICCKTIYPDETPFKGEVKFIDLYFREQDDVFFSLRELGY